jgi:hypothetical protein
MEWKFFWVISQIELLFNRFADASLNDVYFMEPFKESLPFEDCMQFLEKTRQQCPPAAALPEASPAKLQPNGQILAIKNTPVAYIQTQNGNFNGEFQSLMEQGDVPQQLPFATEALNVGPPDAVNVWIGTSAAATSLHKDPYENLYAVISGRKHFRLLPPSEAWRMQGTKMNIPESWRRLCSNCFC